MKKTVLMFMALLMTLGLKAQVKPIVLGDKHAMLKVKQGEKYRNGETAECEAGH